MAKNKITDVTFVNANNVPNSTLNLVEYEFIEFMGSELDIGEFEQATEFQDRRMIRNLDVGE